MHFCHFNLHILFRFIDEVISTVDRVLKVLKGQRSLKKRSKSFSVKDNLVPLGKETSYKLQDIAKKEFILNTEIPRTSTIKTKPFIPGVERKKLIKRNTGRSNDSQDICKYLGIIS